MARCGCGANFSACVGYVGPMPSIVAMADTHGFHARLKVPDADVLIHAGDLTGRGTRRQVEEALAWLKSLPHRHKLLVAGNHDFLFEDEAPAAEQLTREAGLIYLRDS